MSVVKELLRVGEEQSLDFGNYELEEKTKLSDFEINGFTYKVKTYKDITRLERNGEMLYESTPGTSVFSFKYMEVGVSFDMYCPSSAQVTLGLKEMSIYRLFINGESSGTMESGLSGKITFNVPEAAGAPIEIRVEKVKEI